MPRKARAQRTGGCHVCSNRQAIGVWKDALGWLLKTCGQPGCVAGYTLVRTYVKEDAA